MFNSMVIQAETHRQNLMEDAEHNRLMREAQNGQGTTFRLHVPTLLRRRNVSQSRPAAQLHPAPCVEV